jgi:hypothetical protein
MAANGHRTAGILAAISAAVWFDFFWTVPYERFTITRHTDLETTVLLLAVGAAVSELAARGRRARHVVVRDTSYMEALRSTSDLIADGHDSREVIDQVQAQLVALLGLRAARFEQGRLLGHPPQLTADGTLVWGEVRWNIDEHGFPSEDARVAGLLRPPYTRSVPAQPGPRHCAIPRGAASGRDTRGLGRQCVGW